MSNLTDPNRIKSFLPWMIQAAEWHAETMERIKATILDPEQLANVLADYQLRTVEVELAIMRLCDLQMDLKVADLKEQNQAEREAIRLIRESLG